MNVHFMGTASRLFARVNLQSKQIETCKNLPEATLHPAVASAPNAIVVCGGMSNNFSMDTCQLYSPNSATYVNQFT